MKASLNQSADSRYSNASTVASFTHIFGLGRAEFETTNWAANALGDQAVLTCTKLPAAKFGKNCKTADQILEMKTGKMLLLTGSKPSALFDDRVGSASGIPRKFGRHPMV